MNAVAANISWLPLPEAVARVARHLGCTPEVAELWIVDAGKGGRIKARGMIESWPVSPLPPAWNGTIDFAAATMKLCDVSCEITNVELLFIDLIARDLLPAPAEKARWPAAEAIAYLVKGVPLPWGAWQRAGASPAEVEQAEIDLGEVIGDGVPAWGRSRPFAQKQQIPADHFHPDMIENKAIPVSVAHQPKVVVDCQGSITTSPRQRWEDYRGPRWQAIEVDSAALKQARPRARPRKQPGPAHDPLLVAAIKKRLKAGHRPGTGGNEQWDRFCDEVRKDCGKEATDRGYGDKTITRIVDELNEQDK